MKKQILALLLTSILITPAWASDLKVGVINMQKLLTMAPQVEEINQKLQKRFSGPKDELDKLAESIQGMEKEIKKNELMMSESKLKKSKENLISKIQQYRAQEAQLGRELKTVQQQELSVFKSVIAGVLDKLASKGDYDLILNDGVMFAKPKLDMTDDILDQLKAISNKK